MAIKLFQRGNFVNLHLQDSVIKFCKITAVKDCDKGYRYDLEVSNVKLYDISQDLLTDVSEEPTKITKSELG